MKYCSVTIQVQGFSNFWVWKKLDITIQPLDQTFLMAPFVVRHYFGILLILFFGQVQERNNIM